MYDGDMYDIRHPWGDNCPGAWVLARKHVKIAMAVIRPSSTLGIL